MHTPRINNAQLFVTVLSACLGLLITGMPSAQAQQRAAATANESQALAIHAAFAQKSSTREARKLAATSNSHFRIDFFRAQSEPVEVCYRNNRALADRNQLLVVTRLPRAALIRLPAE